MRLSAAGAARAHGRRRPTAVVTRTRATARTGWPPTGISWTGTAPPRTGRCRAALRPQHYTLKYIKVIRSQKKCESRHKKAGRCVTSKFICIKRTDYDRNRIWYNEKSSASQICSMK
ncbi:jg4113 [Pararge aegeria aegeria]|uniref:Jg4113 protein n=1 Tax=Pararge aegeria aegeria TaxID=348720 RepID=A0A8S4RUK8_9NEOP|nr:jg4113 [Pararge aegeria aegeria]